jgi:hypothetical protein
MRMAMIFLLLVTVCSASVWAKEPDKRIVVLKERLAVRSYSVILFERRDYDSINHARLDGMVFFPGEVKYHYIRRLNDDHRLRLNIGQGQQATLIKPGDSAKYEALVSENKLFPEVILDKSGREVMIVYYNIREKITWSKEKSGEIYLEVRNPFKKDEPRIPFTPFLRK